MITLALALLLLQPLSTQAYCLHEDCSVYGYSPQVLRFTCADFTKDAVMTLRSGGFTAYPMCGHFHAWVGVEIDGKIISIEPQTGELADYSGRRCVVRGLA